MLSISDISKTYGNQTLFKAVTFNMGVRDRIAIIGPNGSGKTTLFNIIAGNTLPDSGSVNSVSISPDGRWALSGSFDKTLKLWELATGRCLRIFEPSILKGHADSVKSVSISPDGRWGLSGSDDKTVQQWKLATGKYLGFFNKHSSGVTSISISPDGRWVLSGSKDRTLRLWELVWDYELPKTVNWDEGARPYLEIFLTLHTPYEPDGISRIGKPVWNDDDFNKLLKELQYRGYGWLRPEGIRRELEKMTREWKKKSWFSRLFGK